MSKRATPRLADVARRAGVSQMTVSRALRGLPGVSEEKREEILRLAEALGYPVKAAPPRPAAGGSRLVGVVAPYLDHTYAREVLAGLGRAAAAAGYALAVSSPVDGVRTPPGLLERSADGVVALVPYEYRHHPAAATAGRIPVVTVDHGGERPLFPSVAADSYQGGCDAVRHLVALGHRRVAFIGGVERLASARSRHRAWVDVLAAAGVAVDERWHTVGNYTERGGYEGAAALLRLRPRPTALFAANDLSALGAISAAAAAGLSVPRDLSIVGFDDIPAAAQLHPPLTTVRQPLQELGRVAFELLLALMRGERLPAEERLLPVELVVRGSTGPPPRRGGAE